MLWRRHFIICVLYRFTYSACMNHANFERSHNYLQYILFIDTNLNAIYYIHPTTQALRTEKIPWVTFLLFCVRYCVFDFLSENLRHQRSQNVGSRNSTKGKAYERRDRQILLHSINFSLLLVVFCQERKIYLCCAGQLYNLFVHTLFTSQVVYSGLKSSSILENNRLFFNQNPWF